MAVNWMQSAGQKGIPSAFLVNQDAQVVWIGHPSQLSEKTIESVLDGKFDIAKSKAEAEESAKERDAMMRFGARTAKLVAAKKWDEATKAAAELESALPASKKHIADAMRFQIATGSKNSDAANEAARKISAAASAESPLLNQIAWTLLTSKDIEKPDFAAAESLARRGVETAIGAAKAPILDTLARALFLEGKKDDAIKTQEEAIAAASDEKLKASLGKVLDAYKRGELPPAE
jgi:tetratricopeptide (TPR) repeat protein